MNYQSLKKLTNNIYYLSFKHETDRPTLGAIIGSNGTLIVDAGNSPAHANLFLTRLRNITESSPKYLALTHWHWDHVFGTSTMKLITIAHKETNKKLAEMMRLKWDDYSLNERVRKGKEIAFCRDNINLELPDRSALKIVNADIIFQDKVEVNLGNLTCVVENVGGDHSSDSSVVYIPEEKVVFLGDCLGMDLYQPVWTYTTEKLFPLINKLLSYDADYYVDSHYPVVTRDKMVEDCSELKIIGEVVERYRGNREAIIEVIQKRITEETDQYGVKIIKRTFSHYFEAFMSYY